MLSHQLAAFPYMGGSVVHYRKIFVRISAKQSEIRTQSVPDLADHIGESENFSDQGLELTEPPVPITANLLYDRAREELASHPFCRYITGSCAGRNSGGLL